MLDLLGAFAAAVAIEGVVDDVLIPAWRRAVMIAGATRSNEHAHRGGGGGDATSSSAVVVVPEQCIVWEVLQFSPSSSSSLRISSQVIAASDDENVEPYEGLVPAVAVEQHILCATTTTRPTTGGERLSASRGALRAGGLEFAGNNNNNNSSRATTMAPSQWTSSDSGCAETSPMLSWSMSRGNSSGGITACSFSPSSDDHRPPANGPATPCLTSVASPSLPLLRTLAPAEGDDTQAIASVLPPPRPSSAAGDPCLIVLDLDNTLLSHMLEDVSVEHLTEAEKRCLFIDAPFLHAFCEVAHARGHLIGVASYANESGSREYSTCTEVLGLLDAVLPLTRSYLNTPLRIVCYPEFRRDHRPKKQPHIDRLIQNFSLIDDLLSSSSLSLRFSGAAAAATATQRIPFNTSFGATAAAVSPPTAAARAARPVTAANGIPTTASAAWLDDPQLSFSAVHPHGLTGLSAGPSVARAESPFRVATEGAWFPPAPPTNTPPGGLPPPSAAVGVANSVASGGGRASTISAAGRGVPYPSSSSGASCTTSSPGWRSAKPPSLLAVAAAQHEHHQQQMGVSSSSCSSAAVRDLGASPGVALPAPTSRVQGSGAQQHSPRAASFQSPHATACFRSTKSETTSFRIPSTVVLIDDNLGNCTGTDGAQGYHCPTGFHREWFRQESSLQAVLGISYGDIEATGCLT